MATTDSQNLLDSASGVINTASNTFPTSATLKNKLATNTSKLQSLIDAILQKGGILTPEDKNSLSEQIRATQLSILEAESKSTTNKYAIYIGASLGVLAILWYFIYKKKTNE
jgi:hypothetical protein